MFSELDIEDRLQWKRHQMIFAMQVVWDAHVFPGPQQQMKFGYSLPVGLNLCAGERVLAFWGHMIQSYEL